MTFRLPRCLHSGDDDQAVDLLTRYFDPEAWQRGAGFTGSRWDGWDPSDTRAANPDVLTADDILAMGFLSAAIKPRAAEDSGARPQVAD